ncbi:PfkB family carbohydrate kinase [Sphingomonas pruni]|uniref:PfkB family carbohydrate kinase n=1 Tax=Sphingomonas pruni TaxID=40683 RepID=UPI00082DB570|nr:PfkB family carbohydrate kinase [Sphingomonas pruni]
MGDRSESRVLVAGSANADFVVRAARIPAAGETVLGGDLAIFPGGKGANQAVAAARAGGVATRMVAAMGDDDPARLIAASLAGAGVALDIRRSARSTGAALITVSDAGENAITVAPGANSDLGPDDLPDLDGISWLVMQLETPLNTVAAFARAARDRATKVLLNAAPARALPADLLAVVDLLVVNEDELGMLVGTEGSLAERLARTGVAITVVTLGGRGACARVGQDYALQPAFAVTPVDTTAAGDTFCGVLAAGLAEGLDLPAALARAGAAAALATTKAGAQSSIPSRTELDAFIAGAHQHGQDALATYCGLAAAAI